MFLTDSEAIELEFKALKCLRQAQDDLRVRDVSLQFALRAARRLHAADYIPEAENILKKLIDSKCK